MKLSMFRSFLAPLTPPPLQPSTHTHSGRVFFHEQEDLGEGRGGVGVVQFFIVIARPIPRGAAAAAPRLPARFPLLNEPKETFHPLFPLPHLKPHREWTRREA